MNFDAVELQGNPCIREALLFREQSARKVQCNTCYRQCIIKPGKRGYCGARANIGGQLYVLTYGDISSISANPIEKKPLHHFYPGTRALTVGSWGCNAACPWCQNWGISKRLSDPHDCDYLSPEQFLNKMKHSKCQGTSFSLNEPTTGLFEYSLDVMSQARSKGYYNTYVTNGYMTPTALEHLAAAGLDAMNIDVKGCATKVREFCNLDVEKVWASAQRAYNLGLWVEITTLVIPGMNDSTRCLSSIAQRISTELGPEVPWHVSAYFPAYQATNYGLTLSTPIKTLERAQKLGKTAGLYYVYIGNVLGHTADHSYCRNCNVCLIHRIGYDISIQNLSSDGTCRKCGTPNHFILTNSNLKNTNPAIS